MRVGILLVCVSFFLGCSSNPLKVACEQKDWYEVGRHDGAQGHRLDRLAQYRRECGSDFSAGFETVYTNGRNAGLVEYCEPQNAFELGRMGINYGYVCPSTTEPDFLASYRKGQQARQLEIENQKMDSQIDQLLAQLQQAETPYQKRKLASELNSLKKERAKKERELNKVER